MTTDSALAALKAELEAVTDQIWLDEPDEVLLIRSGVNLGGGGSSDQYFSVLVHLEAFMMLLGPHVLYRLILLAEDEQISLYSLKQTTITLFKRPFDHFEFLGDLGLKSTHEFGTRYLEVLEEVQTREEFTEISGAFLTYFNRMFRWIHGIFPWNLGGAYPQLFADDVEALAAAIARVKGASSR